MEDDTLPTDKGRAVVCISAIYIVIFLLFILVSFCYIPASLSRFSMSSLESCKILLVSILLSLTYILLGYCKGTCIVRLLISISIIALINRKESIPN